MGYMRDHAIVVSSWSDGLLAEAHEEASRIFPVVSGICPTLINGGGSFLVPPDGSKEGWDESNEGDQRRDDFIAWLDTKRYEDGSTSLRWVEVQFADDDHETVVIRHSDQKHRRHSTPAEPKLCRTCGGKGFIVHLASSTNTTCPTCKGTGTRMIQERD